MKQHAHLLILTIMFLTSCSDDTEVMKQESSPPSLTEKPRLIVLKRMLLLKWNFLLKIIETIHEIALFLIIQ